MEEKEIKKSLDKKGSLTTQSPELFCSALPEDDSTHDDDTIQDYVFGLSGGEEDLSDASGSLSQENTTAKEVEVQSDSETTVLEGLRKRDGLGGRPKEKATYSAIIGRLSESDSSISSISSRSSVATEDSSNRSGTFSESNLSGPGMPSRVAEEKDTVAVKGNFLPKLSTSKGTSNGFGNKPSSSTSRADEGVISICFKNVKKKDYSDEGDEGDEDATVAPARRDRSGYTT